MLSCINDVRESFTNFYIFKSKQFIRNFRCESRAIMAIAINFLIFKWFKFNEQWSVKHCDEQGKAHYMQQLELIYLQW